MVHGSRRRRYGGSRKPSNKRYVYEAIGKTPSATEMVLRFTSMNIIGITLTVGQAYSKNDVQA